MPVFFIPSTQVVDNTILIQGDLYQHLVKSLRTRPGESLTFNDERGIRYVTTVKKVTRDELLAGVEGTETNPLPRPYSIVLGQAILKGDKMSWVIQKATELGVGTIIPLLTERVILKSHTTNLEKRWSRIALEAAQQSERWAPPSIEAMASFSQFLETFAATPIKLILAERTIGHSLLELPLPTNPDAPIIVAIGPEGGWTSEELALAGKANFSYASLGARVLRSETASLATLAILSSRMQML